MFPFPEVRIRWRKYGRIACSACGGSGAEYQEVVQPPKVVGKNGATIISYSFTTQMVKYLPTGNPCKTCRGSGKVWGFDYSYDD